MQNNFDYLNLCNALCEEGQRAEMDINLLSPAERKMGYCLGIVHPSSHPDISPYQRMIHKGAF